jgi:hypothetical protein
VIAAPSKTADQLCWLPVTKSLMPEFLGILAQSSQAQLQLGIFKCHTTELNRLLTLLGFPLTHLLIMAKVKRPCG